MFANGILTTCRLNNIYPIENMKFIKTILSDRSLEEFENIPSNMLKDLRISEQILNNEELKLYLERLVRRLTK